MSKRKRKQIYQEKRREREVIALYIRCLLSDSMVEIKKEN